jgi:hypothetical protein
MKKILLICTLALVGIFQAWGQAYYRFEFSISFRNPDTDYRYYIWTPHILTSNGSKIDLENIELYQQKTNITKSESINIPASSGIPKSLVFGTSYQHYSWGNWHGDCSNGVKTYSLPACLTKDISINWECLSGRVTVNKLECYPILDIKSQRINSVTNLMENNTIIPEDDKVKIEATAGFPNTVYKWKYSTVPYPYNWKDIPASCYSAGVFNATGKELLQGTGISEQYYKDVYFSIDYGCNNKRSNIIVLNFRPSAPYIVSTTISHNMCFGASEGGIKVVLNRNLLSGETLKVYYGAINPLVVTALESDKSFYIPGLQAGSYTVQISAEYKDNKALFSDGANHRKDVEVLSPEKLSFTATHQDVGCYNGNNGHIVVKANGGTRDYTLHWKRRGEQDFRKTPFAVGAKERLLANLMAGTYDYYVSDANGCILLNTDGSIIIQSETLTQPNTGIMIDLYQSTPPSGYGLSNGSLTIEASGGTGNYSCRWTRGIGLPQSSFDEMINGVFRSTLENVPAALYTVYFTDENGCEQSMAFQLQEPARLSISFNETQSISCRGEQDGAITARISGGVPGNNGYTYKWYKKTNGNYTNLYQYNETVRYLGSGEYKVEVTDGSRIPNTTEAVYLLQDPEFVTLGSVTVKNVTCYDFNDGQITLTAQGGRGGYVLSYKKEGETTYQDVSFGGSATHTLSGLTSGDYYFKLRDRNGCYATFQEGDTKITVQQPEKPLEVKPYRLKNTSGFGRSDGYMSFQVEGGTPNTPDPLSYNVRWKNSQGHTVTPVDTVIEGVFITQISNLPMGTYTLEVRDKNYSNVANACFVTASASIAEPDPLTVELYKTDTVYCHGGRSGELVARVQGGVPFTEPDRPSYTFKWYVETNGQDSLIAEAIDSVLSGVGIGRYKLYVEDSSEPANDTMSVVVEFLEPPLLVTELHTRDIACFGTNDGFIHIHVDGGVGGYRMFYKSGESATYEEHPIHTNDNTFYLDNLPADTFSVYIIDANNCFAGIEGDDIHEIILTQPDAPLGIISFRQRNVSGFGLSNGALSANIGGGTPFDDGSYKVEWTDQHGQTLTPSNNPVAGAFSSTLEGLSIGSYTVIISDKNRTIATAGKDSTCFFTTGYTITEPDELVVEMEETHFVSCYGMSDGELTLRIRGGVSDPTPGKEPYRITWYRQTEGEFVPMTDWTGTRLAGLPGGTYRAVIEDYSWQPNRMELTHQLIEPGLLTATATDVEISCGEVVDVNVWVKGGTPPYRYEWSTGDTDSVIPNAVPGKYMVFITDSRGCQVTALAKVIAPTDMAIRETLHDPLCHQGTNGNIELKVTGGRPPYSFKWNTGATTQNLTGLKAGNYNVIVTDAEKCSAYMDFVLNEPEPISVSIGDDRVLCRGQKLEIVPEVADPKSTYAWTGPDGFRSTDPRVTVDKEGVYRLTITDSNGCQASDGLQVTVKDIDISSEFVVSSDVFVGDTVVVVNISDPQPESLEWIVNESDSLVVVEKTEHLLRFVCKYPGYYPVGLRTFVDECYEDNMKSVTVHHADDRSMEFFAESIIKKFILYPNPNNGVFTVEVELSKASPIRLRIVDIGRGIVLDDARYTGQKEYTVPYSLFLASSVYAVLLETSAGYMPIKMVIK